MTNFFKQVGKSSKDVAKQIAKQIGSEPKELLRNAGGHIGTENKPKTQPEGPSMMQEVMTQNGKTVEATPLEQQQIYADTKSRLAKIEAELRQLRMQRERMSQEWSKEQDRLMNPELSQPPKPVSEIPQGRKQGTQRPGKKKSSGIGNTMENSRQKKG